MPTQRVFPRSVFAEDQTVLIQDSVAERQIIAGIRTVQAASQYGNGLTSSVQAAAVRSGVNTAGHAADNGHTVGTQIIG